MLKLLKRRSIRNVSWLTSGAAGEKAAALLQTLLLAWALGAEGYGVFGFLMSTFGLVSALAGLQLGITSAVFVSRYRETAPSKARSVVKKVSLLGSLLALGLTAILAPSTPWLTDWLLGSSESALAVLLTTLLLPLTVTAGIQEGVLQGFEDFKSLALIRLGSSLLSLALIYPAVSLMELAGAMGTMAVCLSCKLVALLWRVNHHVKELPLDNDDSLNLRELTTHFALPSLLGTLVTNGSNWFGSYLLSRQAGGFVYLAIVNVGIQWRDPLQMLARIAVSVMVPRISAHHEKREHHEVRRLKNRLILWVGLITLGNASLIVVSSPWILAAYGDGFSDGELIMVLVVASAVPQVISNIYLQNYLATGRAWRQFFLILTRGVPTAVLMWFLVDRWGAIGYGAALLVSWSAFAIEMAFLDWREARKSVLFSKAVAVSKSEQEGHS